MKYQQILGVTQAELGNEFNNVAIGFSLLQHRLEACYTKKMQVGSAHPKADVYLMKMPNPP